MSYILNTDKLETFECNLALEGAELKDSVARVIIEADNHKLLFEGEIKDSGDCRVELKKSQKDFHRTNCWNFKV